QVIDVNLNFMPDRRDGSGQQWQPLGDTTGDAKEFARRYGAASQHNVIHFRTFDPENLNSVLSCLRAARESARSVREVISSEMWAQLNEFYLMVDSSPSRPARLTDPHELLASVKMSSPQFAGVNHASMTHNHRW